MGIESDKLVLDYLSRVGDLAQTAMPAADRMRLVARLRNDIDAARGRTAGDSPAAVRRILGRIGPPDEVVAGAATTPGVPAPTPAPAPAAGSTEASRAEASRPGGSRAGGTGGLLRKAFGGGGGAGAGGGAGSGGAGDGGSGAGRDSGASAGGPGTGMTPPPGVNEILAGSGSSGDGPDWWRTSGGPSGDGMLGGDLSSAGWTGGLIMSEFQDPAQPPPAPGTAAVPRQGEPGAHVPGRPLRPAAPPPTPAPAPAPAREKPARKALRLAGLLRARPQPVPAPAPVEEAPRRRIPPGPVEALAAVALVAGALLTNIVVLAAGWLLAYTTRGIPRRQAQFAALGVPGVVVACAIIWFWGRASGHWGPPIGSPGTGAAFTAALPVVLRTAAVASALYLLWRGLIKRG